jgi:hypothetical protein
MLLPLLVCCMRVVHGQGVHYGVQSVFEANERLDMKATRKFTSKVNKVKNWESWKKVEITLYNFQGVQVLCAVKHWGGQGPEALAGGAGPFAWGPAPNWTR